AESGYHVRRHSWRKALVDFNYHRCAGQGRDLVSTEEFALIALTVTYDQCIFMQVLLQPIRAAETLYGDASHTICGDHLLQRLPCPMVRVERNDRGLGELLRETDRVVSKLGTHVDDLLERLREHAFQPRLQFHLVGP